MGAAAIAAATAAVTAFAAASVKVGMEFDSSMSQVAATMGKTVDEIQSLRDFALEMGSTTMFTASQAAEALNYMALAGYDAEESMSALPNVLNLAAAGNMDLAAASDMVTDAQSALGLTMEQSAVLVDQMAKAASKSNTSVAQLGDAILTVGGTANYMSGGTEELATVLGILADNGIKGAEGGTHLRNMLLSMSAPTKEAQKTLKNLGVSIFDADGNMRSFAEIFPELSAAMDDLTDQQKLDAFSTIFNTRDIAAATALMSTSTERWEELGDAILDSAGAAQQMADTKLDNLAGDVTKFKSALEGAQITIGTKLTPKLRQFTQFGTQAITTLSDAFAEGGLTGAMDALGTILSDGLDMVISGLPNMIDAGMQLLGALGQGILGNLPTITSAAGEILTMLVEGIASALPQLAQGAVQIITTLANDLAVQLPQLVPIAVDAVLQLVETLTDPDTLGNLVSAAIAIITGLADGLLNSIDTLLEKAPVIVQNLVTAIVENAPKLLTAAFELIVKLAQGLVDPKNLLKLAGVAWDIVMALVDGIIALAAKLLDLGKSMVMAIWDGIKSMAEWLKDNFIKLVSSILYTVVDQAVGGFMTSALGYIGVTPGDLFDEIDAASVKFSESALAKTTEAMAGAMGPDYSGAYSNQNIYLVTPDGKTLAEYIAKPFSDYMSANGTPLNNVSVPK